MHGFSAMDRPGGTVLICSQAWPAPGRPLNVGPLCGEKMPEPIDNPLWDLMLSTARVHPRALRKLQKRRRPRDFGVEAKLNAAIESARAVMAPIEEAFRARDPQHAAAARELQAAEAALNEAGRRLALATARAERTRSPASPHNPPNHPSGPAV